MRIALAAPPIATSVDDALQHVERMTRQAAQAGARIVCFPEAYVPGLRGQDFPVADFTADDEQGVMDRVSSLARDAGIAVILGTEHLSAKGRHIAAAVFDATGVLLGAQLKTQLDPSEDAPYIPGDSRRVFEVEGLKFGIAICHEGWRYPETVRWAAVRGAHIVFHPQLTGSDRGGPTLTTWGALDNPYYERAMGLRSRENTIWFASVNYGVRFQEAATSLIAPSGELHAALPYGGEGLLVSDIDLGAATGLLARRYAPERYQEA